MGLRNSIMVLVIANSGESGRGVTSCTTELNLDTKHLQSAGVPAVPDVDLRQVC